MTPLLDCTGIHKAYGAVRALRGASLTVEENTVHGLVGHNGAGKSTLVKVIVGLEGWDEGSVTFAGDEVADSDRRSAIARGIWAVPQELTVLPDMTVADNVNIGDEPHRGPWVRGEEMRRRADEALARLGLDLDPNARVDELRPSEQRMVMIAMAVGRDCRLLILDEPTASLGTDEAEPLLKLVESLPGRGITVLYVSHRLDEVARLCNRVTVMRDGVSTDTLERGQFDTRELVSRMVDELPDRVPRLQRARSEEVAVRLRGVHGFSLRGLDVDVRVGAITGFTGLLGSGADEALAMIAGAARPAAGTVEVHGKEVKFRTPADALRAGIGYVPGTRAESALTELTLRENVLASSLDRVAAGSFVLVGPREGREARRWVSSFGLGDRVEAPLSDLSGGNQQKVLLARLLAADAKILVVNDPTAGVDFRARADLHELLRGAADGGLAVIVRCSEPEELLDLADEVHVLAGGRLARSFEDEHMDLGSLLEAASSSGVDLHT